jgi:uncharacterized glyoxalase superfamily protein PhnB
MTLSNPTVWLTLQATDAPALIDYYVDTFGFVVAARYGEGDNVDHAQLNWPEGSGGIMLAGHRPGVGCSREPGMPGAYVVTTDPDTLYERVLARKVDIVRPLARPTTGPRIHGPRPAGQPVVLRRLPGRAADHLTGAQA